MTHPTHLPYPPYLPFLTATWFAMMAAMMVPTVWPWIRSVHRLGGSAPLFASGYCVAWLGYSLAAAGIQTALHPSAAIAPLLLAAAGVYQFAPLKRACLTHCRNPISYFLVRWRNGPSGAFRMGIGHGVYCVGCCWALMATMIAVGTTNMVWMVVLAGVTFVEQVVPHGDRIRIPLGLALIATACVV